MSDYIYILESHLSPEQNRVVSDVQAAAGESNATLFLTGGAMRDMLGGFRIRDLDFVIEGNALKVARAASEHAGARIVFSDEGRKYAELVFPGGVTAQIAMSRVEKYGRPGAKPQISPATIQEDLRGRDFTCNAIALSLNKASRGLLLDPLNGLADIERRELRAASAYGFYDDPTRLLRLIRLQARLGFTIEARTQMQVENAREAEVQKNIPPRAFGEELKRISAEDNPAAILKALEDAGLLALFTPVLAGPKMSQMALTRFEKAIRLLPDDAPLRAARWGPFMAALTEKLAPKEKQSLIHAIQMPKEDADLWLKLEARSKKLETALRSARIRKPSQVYHIVSTAAADEVLFLLSHSALKPVQERLRSYFQKYLPAVQEITPEEWAAIPVKAGMPRYNKARDEFVAARLDRRPPRKPAPEEAPPPPPPEIEPAAARRTR
jgi:tRNA nucleotidyltransferase/poly(A) polymerase